MNVLQKIFKEHFEKVKASGISIRETVIENVRKMVRCGDMKYGYILYGCEECGKIKYAPLRCKSRFCTACGNLYCRRRSTAMSYKLINCRHRHCVFSIPKELRSFFRADRNLLSCLFHAVRDVILRMFHKMNKSEKFTPGFICALHTFGRDLKWNPHIHVLLSEGGSGNKTPWRHVKHFNYALLRNSFRTALLNLMEKQIGASFKKTKAYICRHCPDGFYVYAKPAVSKSKDVIKYIGRYLGRPVIASSRIDSYDGHSVTFRYNRHEDDILVTETVDAVEFIKKLIVHIPDKHFKMIRYYGIYAKHHKNAGKFVPAVPAQKRRFLSSLNNWRTSLLLDFGVDPLLCSCGHSMICLDICLNGSLLSDSYRNKRFDSS